MAESVLCNIIIFLFRFFYIILFSVFLDSISRYALHSAISAACSETVYCCDNSYSVYGLLTVYDLHMITEDLVLDRLTMHTCLIQLTESRHYVYFFFFAVLCCMNKDGLGM